MSSSASAAQFTATNGPCRRLAACTARATSSLPAPLSPSIRTGNGDAAARGMASRSCRISSLTPTRPRAAGVDGGAGAEAMAASSGARRSAPALTIHGAGAAAPGMRGRHRNSPTGSAPYSTGTTLASSRAVSVGSSSTATSTRGACSHTATEDASTACRRRRQRWATARRSWSDAVMPTAGARHGPSPARPASLDCRRPAPPGRRRNFVYNSRAMLRFLTAGESHGRGLVVIVDGLPAGLPIDLDRLTHALRRRQGGYGRGRRMAIESDTAVVQSGVRRGRTTGAPVALLIENRDWVNWQRTMHTEAEAPDDATGRQPRPGRPSATRARRSRRRPEVRARGRARRARTGQRPGDGGARRRRRPRAATAGGGRRVGGEPRHRHRRGRPRRRSRRQLRRSARPWPPTVRCGAWTPHSRRA